MSKEMKIPLHHVDAIRAALNAHITSLQSRPYKDVAEKVCDARKALHEVNRAQGAAQYD